MNARTYLIKRALPDPLGFQMRQPFHDPRPNEFTRDDQRFLEQLLAKLPPSNRRPVKARIQGRREVTG